MYDTEKALQALLYVAQQHDRADKHKVFKTLYFAEQTHMVRYGAPLLGDLFVAMPFGPVPRQTYDIVKADTFALRVEGDVIEAVAQPDLDYLSESEIECLDEAIALCATKSFRELCDLSHDAAWRGTSRNSVMSPVDIARAGGAPTAVLAYLQDVLATKYVFA